MLGKNYFFEPLIPLGLIVDIAKRKSKDSFLISTEIANAGVDLHFEFFVRHGSPLTREGEIHYLHAFLSSN